MKISKEKVLKHNNKTLNNPISNSQKKPATAGKKKFPLDNKCLAKNIIYRAITKTNSITKFYVGSKSTKFKNRYINHKASFNNKLKRYNTELSNYIWGVKRRKQRL